jgi:co-chaperonin GroES (HSP10)
MSGLLIPEHVALAKARKQAQAAKARPVEVPAAGRIRRPFSVRTPLGKRAKIYLDVVHERDPKESLLQRIGNIPAEVVQFNRILVAIYQPPVTNKVGSVLITEQMTEEDQEEALWQGKVGLVVAKGPQAYVDDEATKFHGQSVTVGDWVWFRPSDGMGCDVNEVPCRTFYERDIIGKIPHPDYVW